MPNTPLTDKQLLSILSLNKNAVAIYTGIDLVIESATDSMIAFWGKDRSVIGQPLGIAVPELQGQPFLQILRDVLTTGINYSATDAAANLKVNGKLETFYYDFEYAAIKNEQGQAYAILHTANDVTERNVSRKAAEQLLREKQLNEQLNTINVELLQSQKNYLDLNAELEERIMERTNALTISEAKAHYLIADAPVAIALFVGHDLIIESANQKILELWGKHANIINKPLIEGLPELEGQPFIQILLDVFDTGVSFFGNEVKVILERGGKLEDCYFNFVYHPVKSTHGHTYGIMVVATEVTSQVVAGLKLKESQQSLQLLADNITQLTWMTDHTGYIYWYNQRWYEYTGTTLEEMKGWGWQKVHHPDHIDSVTEKFKHHIDMGQVWEDTFPLKGKNGEYRWFLSRALPLRDDDGKIIRWFGTNTDITEEHELGQMKDDFLSVVSHELKTPITSLKANLQLLGKVKDDPANPLIPRLIDSSTRSMEKINSLVDDLLNMRRYGDAQLHLEKTHFTIWEMLQVCCNHVRIAGQYELCIHGEKDLQICADEHRIDQVVVNLVNNAIKYAPDCKKIYLNISKQNNFAKIAVRDTGPGIAPEQIPHLFARYWRANHNTGSTYSGLGLGLYICAEIIQRHGGHIGVDSELGKGSEFWFTLPLEA